MSIKYICKRNHRPSSPILNAAVGEVGVTIASTSSNAFKKIICGMKCPGLFCAAQVIRVIITAAQDVSAKYECGAFTSAPKPAPRGFCCRGWIGSAPLDPPGP